MRVEGWFDGSCEPLNPGGVVGYGWHMDWDWEDVEEFAVAFSGGDFATNNVAEFIALQALLMECILRTTNGPEFGSRDKVLVIRGDNQLVINTFNGLWSSSKAHLKPIVAITNMLKEKLIQAGWTITAEQIGRAYNGRADRLSRRALNEIEKARMSLTEQLGEEYYEASQGAIE